MGLWGSGGMLLLLTKRIFLLMKIFVLFLIAIFVPKFFILCVPTEVLPSIESKQKFKLGLENILDELVEQLEGKNIGLITNQTGIDHIKRRNIDLLKRRGIKIATIFTPEHGIKGAVEAGVHVNNDMDQKTGISIVSLYEGDSKFKNFKADDLKNIDAFIFDIQDCGMRHYTYISILFRMLQVAAKFNKTMIILDRPNPLGIVMGGPLVEPELQSFVSIAPIPLRHGMTFGELALYFNKYLIKPSVQNLIVVQMRNYTRDQGLSRKLDVFLSPNIKNIDSLCGYSFLGLLGEIKPFDVTVGTEHAFQCILLPNSLNLPQSKWQELQKILLNNHGIETLICKYTKKPGQDFTGLKISINDINDFSSFNTLLDILKFFRNAGIKFSYAKILDKAVGTSRFRKVLDKTMSRAKFAKIVNPELDEFFNRAKEVFIYEPVPKVVKISL